MLATTRDLPPLDLTELLAEWPADPKEQIALADALDARARVLEFRARLLRDYRDWRTALEHAVDLRQLAVQLRDTAWRQMGA